MKKVFVIVVVAVILITTLILVLNVSKEETNMYKSQIPQITEFNIDGRVVLKKDNNIFVGNNLKELENGFYDIKIVNLQYEIQVYLNKLWYEKYGNDYIQDEYLAKMCRELSNKLNIKGDTQQFEYVLYKYIKENYIKVRKNEIVDKISTDQYSLELNVEESVVKLLIRGV